MVFYSLTVLFSYVSTKWVVPENIYTPMEEINNPPLPFYGHPAQIQDILYIIIPFFLCGQRKFPLWVGYGSFWNDPRIYHAVASI